MGHSENSAERNVQSTMYPHEETGISHSRELTEHQKTLEQKEANIPRSSRCQEIGNFDICNQYSLNKENNTKNQ